MTLLLFPRDPLSARHPDPHFAPEAEAARDLGLRVALVDHDNPRAGARGAEPGPALYRGWMLRAEQYAVLEQALQSQGVELLTRATQYAAAHHLPGWYEAFRQHTPARSHPELGPFPAVVKDHVKSLKHYWDEAMYIPDAQAASRVIQRFLELRGEDLVGEPVLRAFERLGREARTWWVDGRCVLLTAHPDTPDELPAGVPTEQLTDAVKALGCPRITVDLALRDDGVWRVVEVGDAQVSDRPQSLAPRMFLQAWV